MSRDALVVGINTYQNLNPLKAPAADAEAIAQRLQQDGEFRVWRSPEIMHNNQPQVGKTTPVTVSELTEALTQLFTPEGRQIPDTALFYFSGHGLHVKRGVSDGYLATSDIDHAQSIFGVSLLWLRRLLEESPVRQQIIWLDCCHSGALLNVEEANPGGRGQARDRCFIAASRDYQIAYEDFGDAHSVLTKALLDGLDPTRHPERGIDNLLLTDFVNQALKGAIQSPVCSNFGEPILLTRQWQGTEPIAAASPRSECPYRGLTYFDCNEEDPKYFYGRTALTDQLLDQVRQNNFLAIVGASGSGKSSVLRAGLIQLLPPLKLSP
jgi:Caspase domain